MACNCCKLDRARAVYERYLASKKKAEEEARKAKEAKQEEPAVTVEAQPVEETPVAPVIEEPKEEAKVIKPLKKKRKPEPVAEEVSESAETESDKTEEVEASAEPVFFDGYIAVEEAQPAVDSVVTEAVSLPEVELTEEQPIE